MRSPLVLFLTVLLSYSTEIVGVWNTFSFIRNFPAPGSNFTTPLVKITANTANGPNITVGSYFGYSVANLNDINGDGHDDVAVGAIGEDVNYGNGTQPNAGTVYVMLMGRNATIKSTVRINGNNNNGPKTFSGDQFGYSLARIGDLDGDGIDDLAVGAPGSITSAVYVLFLHANGTVRTYTRIRGRYTSSIAVADDVAAEDLRYAVNGPPISYGSRFGSSLTTVGDFNKDGVSDLIVSAIDSSTGHSIIYILYLSTNATVIQYVQLESETFGMPTIPNFSGFGTSMVMLPDLNNDSIPELAVGAPFSSVTGSLNTRAGYVYVLFLTANGSVNSSTVITETSGELKYNDPALRLPSVVRCSYTRAPVGICVVSDLCMCVCMCIERRSLRYGIDHHWGYQQGQLSSTLSYRTIQPSFCCDSRFGYGVSTNRCGWTTRSYVFRVFRQSTTSETIHGITRMARQTHEYSFPILWRVWCLVGCLPRH